MIHNTPHGFAVSQQFQNQTQYLHHDQTWHLSPAHDNYPTINTFPGYFQTHKHALLILNQSNPPTQYLQHKLTPTCKLCNHLIQNQSQHICPTPEYYKLHKSIIQDAINAQELFYPDELE